MNFEPLLENIDFASAKAEYSTSKKYRSMRIGLRVIVGAIIFFTGISLLASFSEGGDGAIRGLLIAGLALCGVYLFRGNQINQNKEVMAYTKFCEDNGLGYVHHKETIVPYDASKDVLMQRKGAIFGVGDATNLIHAISNDAFAIYTYSYTTGSGKNKKTHYWTVLASKLTKKLPHVLFDNKRNNFWKFSNLPAWFSKDQKVSLGGTMDEYFDFYSPEGYDIDTLSYITPELLELLKQEFNNYDIEVVDNILYVYKDGRHSRKQVPVLHTRLQALAAEINQNSRVYKDDRIALHANTASSSAAHETIAKPGQRLKKNRIPAYIGAGLLVLFFSMFSLFQASVVTSLDAGNIPFIFKLLPYTFHFMMFVIIVASLFFVTRRFRNRL